jgi:hypothetical protein
MPLRSCHLLLDLRRDCSRTEDKLWYFTFHDILEEVSCGFGYYENDILINIIFYCVGHGYVYRFSAEKLIPNLHNDWWNIVNVAICMGWPRKRLFSQVVENMKKRGESWHSIAKERLKESMRDWGLLKHRLIWSRNNWLHDIIKNWILLDGPWQR